MRGVYERGEVQKRVVGFRSASARGVQKDEKECDTSAAYARGGDEVLNDACDESEKSLVRGSHEGVIGVHSVEEPRGVVAAHRHDTQVAKHTERHGGDTGGLGKLDCRRWDARVESTLERCIQHALQNRWWCVLEQ